MASHSREPLRRLPLLGFVLAAGIACNASTRAAPPADAAAADSVPVLAEAWHTERDTLDNIDSPAVWHGPNGEHWVLATAKYTDVLVVYDANTGATVRRVGGTGTGPGQMERPNGVAVIDDLAIVVERDNHRVQVFRMPAFTPLGSFADTLLTLPYGVAVIPLGAGEYTVYVTDNYELGEDMLPPDSLLNRRVQQFRMRVTSDGVTAEHVRAFGATSGPGVLKVVESIAADEAHDRLLIAEELEVASHLKVYDLEGEFTGTIIGEGMFPHQAEGIILYECGENEGYWVATDQDRAVNTFHVFDRATLAHVGSFRGELTRNTDGIALSQQGFGDFPTGILVAVHDDGSVAAFEWGDIASALGLRTCPAGGR
ncbi:MAG: phytase [Gemmatimonadota bacterium]|nr:phytase [Gemmatimonadota bacterium]